MRRWFDAADEISEEILMEKEAATSKSLGTTNAPISVVILSSPY